MKVNNLPRVIIGGVHLVLHFHGSHNHDGQEYENRLANNVMNEKTLTTYVTTNTEIRHFRIALQYTFCASSPPDLHQSNIVSNFSRLLQGGDYSSPLPTPQKRMKTVLMQNLVLGGGG